MSNKNGTAGAGRSAGRGMSRGRAERFAALKARQMESVGRLEFDRTGACQFTPQDADQTNGLRLLAEKFNWELVLPEAADGPYTVINLRQRARYDQREAEWALIKAIRPLRFHSKLADVMPESEAEEQGIRLLAGKKGWKVRKADDGRLYVSVVTG